jgi:cytosine/adenosine deaminase-related metal-dependent hydrolase
VFHELLGFNLLHGRRVEETRPLRDQARARSAPTVKVSVAPHACYSVSPQMFRAIREELDASDTRVTSVHVGESDGEMQFLRDGTGPWVGLLKWVGSWVDEWEPPRCGPVEYLHGLGLLDADSLVVHGVQLSDESLAALARIGCTLVTCPRSNQWVGVGVPPIARFYASGVRVAVGTDSLASVGDLNLFSELKTMRWLAPAVPARTLLESATLVGAHALGIGGEIGSIEAGKASELIAVSLPENVTDIEEHLVSGIEPRDIRWVHE